MLCSLNPGQSFAQSFDQGPVFTVIEENDLIIKTDRHYTQGIKLSYLGADNDLPRWGVNFSDKIPALGMDVHATRWGIEIGQNIYTPSDISVDKPLPGDRPYAGWFYTGLVLQRRGLTPRHHLVTLENLQLDLGIIGPESLANQSQSWVHELRGFALPKGWRNQLKDEPGLALKYERSWRISATNNNPWSVDFIPRIGTILGNVETSIRASAMLRMGWQLPDDFGPQTIESITTPEGGISKSPPGSSLYSVYVFAGAQGKALGYTAFLDGNLFQHSLHVEREPLVAEFSTGMVLALSAVELGVTYAYRTREFTHQTEHDGYGSIFIKARF